MTIQRYPNSVGLMRGPNKATILCNKCLEDRTHGFWLFDNAVMKQAIFVCDDCLNDAKKGKK